MSTVATQEQSSAAEQKEVLTVPQQASPASMEEEEIFKDHDSDGGDEPNQQLFSSPDNKHGPTMKRGTHSPAYSSDSRRHSGPGPSESLMRTTQARECEKAAWGTHLEEKKIASSPQPIKRQDPNYVPGERLMKPTQSRIHERRQWEEYLKNKPYEDDIWWEKRKPAPVATAAHKNAVSSRLTEPTVAALHGKREKHPIKKEDRSNIESPSREHFTSVAKIDIHSPLLKTTCAFNHQQVDKEGNLLYPPEDNFVKTINLEAKNSGPAAVSKLMYHTKSFEHSKWTANNSGSDGEKKDVTSPRRASSANIKPPSARLLEFNTAMNAQRREKAVKPEPDSREIGWNQFHHKDKIPSELPSFTPMHRSASGSPSGSPTRRSISSYSQDPQQHVFNRMAQSLEDQHLEDGSQQYHEEDHGEYDGEHYGDDEQQHYDDHEQEYHDEEGQEGEHHYEDDENADDGTGGEEHFQEVANDHAAYAAEEHEDAEQVEEGHEDHVEGKDEDEYEAVEDNNHEHNHHNHDQDASDE